MVTRIPLDIQHRLKQSTLFLLFFGEGTKQRQDIAHETGTYIVFLTAAYKLSTIGLQGDGTMDQAYIQATSLQQARNLRELPVSVVADALPVKHDRYHNWAAGHELPTFKQAQKLASILHIPFGYLFLKEIPKRKVDIPDYRTLENKAPFSEDFLDLYGLVTRQRDWYSEYRKTIIEAPPLQFVGKHTTRSTPQEMASSLKTLLGYEEAQSGKDVTLTNLVSRAAKQSIIIQRSGSIDGNTRRPLSVEEFRGFVICDTYAPFVFINSKDTEVAQIFILMHELAHIILGESGVDSPHPGTERLCNRTAVEFLLPSSIIDVFADCNTLPRIKSKAKRYSVSVQTLLIRLVTWEILNQDQYDQLLAEYQGQPFKKEQGGGGNYYRNLRSRINPRLLETLVESVRTGDTLHREAQSLLKVSANTFATLLKGDA